MTRTEGIQKLRTPPKVDLDLVDMILKRFGFSTEEFEKYMNMPKRNFREFKTYKPLFERLRPLFKILSDFDLIPKSFYVKYTSKDNI